MFSIGFILAPLVACILIVAVNVYFGIHVIKREIIFIDIALASIAALGSAVGMVLFHIQHENHSGESHGILPYLFSVAFISLASAAFSMLKHKKISIPLEAIIGISYAVATTLTVIFLDKGAGGDVHVHDMLVGSVLWVSWSQVLRLALIVLLVGTFHIVFRKKFTRMTDNFQEACNELRSPRLWDFLFYLSFGLVVVEAVNISGILTVFAFLIIPASLTAFITRGWIPKLLVGWSAGILASFFGLVFSLKLDVPSAPVIIVLLGVMLILVFIWYKISQARSSSNL
jgi:zinc/manganese transport system permease protein